MRYGAVVVVVCGLDILSPVGLEAQKYVSVYDPGNRHLIVHGEYLARRGSPIPLDEFLLFFR